jgi:CIC family chloride channel protein
MAKKNYLRSFLIWRYRHISDSQFKHILSVVVGLLSGLAAVSLKNITHIIQEFLTRDFISELRNTWYFVLPLIGLTTVFLIIKYLIKKPIFQGIPSTIYAISKKKGFLSNYQAYASIITAPLTIGFGGSVGLESPTVATGASWSSALSRAFHLDQKTRILLIGCAAAGAMASLFKAPITAIVFAIEIFSLELTTASLIPLLLASISAVLTSYFFFGNDVLFHVKLVSIFKLQDLGFYVILGVVCAVISIYFSKVHTQINNWFKPISSPLKRLFIGGSLLGLVIFFIPPLYGEGYETINSILAGDALDVIKENFFGMEIGGFASIVALLIGLIIFKVIAMGLTMGAGGIGGVFAPTLFTGSITGYLVAYIVNSLGTFQNNLSETSFAMVGMAGLVAGILQAPLTAIFLIAEITEGYELFVPLMIVTTISYLITKQYVPYNIYVAELAKKGQLITHNRDNNALLLMSTDQVIEQNFIEIKPDMFLGEMLENAVSKSNRNIFPVVNDQKEFIGIVLLDDIRTIMFDASLHEKVRISELMHAAPGIIIYEEDNMQAIMQKFKTSGAWNLPVIKKGRYHGFISKSKLLSAYRTKLLQVSAS